MQTVTRGLDKVRYIKDPKEARRVVDKVAEAHAAGKHPALDFETTALRPDESADARVRLTSISFDKHEAFVLDHDHCGSFASFSDDLIFAAPYYVFNAGFEGRWFYNEIERVTDLSRRLLDVGHMKRAVEGGGPLWLRTMAKYDLKIELGKEEQKSNWGAKVLTADQVFYAGLDAIVTKRLGDLWSSKMSEGHWSGFWVINESWRAVNECEDTGLLIDEAYHERLIRMWTRRRDAAETAFRKYVRVEDVANMRSKIQMSNFLKLILDEDAVNNWPKTDKTEQLKTKREILRGMSFASPYPLSRALAAYMVFTRADKYLSTYGEVLLTKQRLAKDGRIHSRLNMAQAITGRFSSSGPNQQNFPNAWYFRYTLIAGEGRKFALADYSGVEIRVLAEMSNDKILLHDAIYDDVHSRSAIAIFKIANADEFVWLIKHDPKKDRALTERESNLRKRYKAMRTRAKAFTFQLLYGAGAGALAIALRCSVSEAEEAIKSWAGRYSKAYGMRQTMFEKMRHDGYLPCASGRTIFVKRIDRTMPVAANYPIQGSAGDVMYRAMYHAQRLLEEREVPAQLCASVHDEMLVLAEEDWAEEARQCLQEGMIQGWLDIFPGSNTDNLVDAVVGDRWSDKA